MLNLSPTPQQIFLIPKHGEHEQEVPWVIRCWHSPLRILHCHRDAYGIPPIVKMMELSKDDGPASAAADAIRALTLNNNSNKEAVREAWALPLLVKLLSSVSCTSDRLPLFQKIRQSPKRDLI